MGQLYFQHENRCVEEKTTGWKLEPDRKHITFTDDSGVGTLRLVGNKKQSVTTFPRQQVRRVRIACYVDGSSCQFGVQAQRRAAHTPTGKAVDIGPGLQAFYADADGHMVENLRH